MTPCFIGSALPEMAAMINAKRTRVTAGTPAADKLLQEEDSAGVQTTAAKMSAALALSVAASFSPNVIQQATYVGAGAPAPW